VFDKEKTKLESVYKKLKSSNSVDSFGRVTNKPAKYDYTEWLFKPKTEFIKFNECEDENDYLYLEQNRIDFIDGAIHVFNTNQSNVNDRGRLLS
jgi:hypothetical protein